MHDSSKTSQRHDTRCETCGELTPSYDIVNSGSIEKGYRQLCGGCFNTEVAEQSGLTGFQHVRFDPVVLKGNAGRRYEFHFRTHLFVTGVAIDAFELRNGEPAGYHFKIIGDPEEDLLALLARLIDKMRRALSMKHLKSSDLGLQISDQVVRGRIEWDPERDGRVPLVVIDGREIDWEEFGRMLMTFEGFQFKLNIADLSEEV